MSNTPYGTFLTHANLTQTLHGISLQHYAALQKKANPNAPVPPLSPAIGEGLHMVCHTLAGIINGNYQDPNNWSALAKQAELVATTLLEVHTQQENQTNPDPENNCEKGTLNV